MPSIPQRRLLSWKIPCSHVFFAVLPSNEAKNASRMSLGCLSNPSKMPFVEIYKQQNNLFTADEACHVAINMWGFKVSKGSVFLMLSRRKPIGIGSDLIEKWVKISYTKICDSSLRPCIPAILHPCDPAPLRPYTLHLTPYVFIFHFAILAFRSRQNAKWQERAGTRCLPTPATFLCFFIFFYYTWRYQS